MLSNMVHDIIILLVSAVPLESAFSACDNTNSVEELYGSQHSRDMRMLEGLARYKIQESRTFK